MSRYIVNIRKVATRCKMKINMAVWQNTCRPAAVARGYTTFCCWARGDGLDFRPRLPHCDRGGMQKRSWPPGMAEINPASPTTASVIAGVSFLDVTPNTLAEYLLKLLASFVAYLADAPSVMCLRVYGRLWEQFVRRSETALHTYQTLGRQN